MFTLFVSDVHLGEERPAEAARFLALLAGPARRADALYLLGDVFDAWLGDDDARPLHDRVATALDTLAEDGTEVHLMHGNHDFLLGEGYAARCGARLLPDPSVVEVYGERVLASHGDLWCTDDTEYQVFRSWSRQPANQQAFLALPLAERARQAHELRERSRASTALKPADIMDVNQEAVAGALREHAVDVLVHGHTHRPAAHDLRVDGRRRTRFVALEDAYHGDTLKRRGSTRQRAPVTSSSRHDGPPNVRARPAAPGLSSQGRHARSSSSRCECPYTTARALACRLRSRSWRLRAGCASPCSATRSPPGRRRRATRGSVDGSSSPRHLPGVSLLPRTASRCPLARASVASTASAPTSPACTTASQPARHSAMRASSRPWVSASSPMRSTPRTPRRSTSAMSSCPGEVAHKTIAPCSPGANPQRGYHAAARSLPMEPRHGRRGPGSRRRKPNRPVGNAATPPRAAALPRHVRLP